MIEYWWNSLCEEDRKKYITRIVLFVFFIITTIILINTPWWVMFTILWGSIMGFIITAWNVLEDEDEFEPYDY